MPPSQKEHVRFRERADLLDFLLEVSTVTAETLDLDRLLSSVAEIIKDVVPYELFAILLYNERAKSLRMRYSIGHRDEILKNLNIRLGEGITGTAASTRQPILQNDVRKDPRYLNALDAVRAELTVPMQVRGKLVGVIDLQSTRLNAFTQQDRALLTLIATRVATAIDNAWLYRKVERQNRTLRVLAHLSQEFSSILEIDELLGKIASTVRALINFDAFSVFLADRDRQMLRCRFSQRYDERTTIENVEFGKGVTGHAIETRQVIRVPDVALEPRYIASHPDVRSEVAVPLVLHDRAIGVLDLESTRLSFFSDDHIRALNLLAPQIATSVENARLYEELVQREHRLDQDLKAAFKLQSVLIPRTVPDIVGLEAGVKTRPARAISGDLYDFFEPADDHALIVFGDVSGKGAAAALYGALISGLLRTLVRRGRRPAEMMRSLNEALLERRVDAQYATLSLIIWAHGSRTFTIASAGTLPPLVFRQSEIIRCRVAGVPIGLLENQDYEQIEIATQPGDLLLLCSDGIEDQLGREAGILSDEQVSAQDPESFGASRIEQSVSANLQCSPQQIVDKLFVDIDEFRGATVLSDDQTVIALRVL